MTPTEALACIQSATQWEFTQHGLDRMMERGATKADVKHAVATATLCEASTTNVGTWVVTGVDRDKEELSACIAIEIIITGDVRNVVVTVF